ncbi:hypothetical protein [Streptomyces sp. NPDC059008]
MPLSVLMEMSRGRLPWDRLRALDTRARIGEDRLQAVRAADGGR